MACIIFICIASIKILSEMRKKKIILKNVDIEIHIHIYI